MARHIRRLLAGAVAGALLAACTTTTSGTGGTPAPAGTSPTATAPAPAPGLALQVSDDRRYLVDEAGEPFLWLADTAWTMPLRLTREEVGAYLDKRVEQGFTVIQTVAVFPHVGGPGPNAYGDSPFATNLGEPTVTEGADPGDDQQYDYWDHLDYIVAAAEERGLRVALWPAWADSQVGDVLRKDNADAYGRFLGARYGSDVVWVLGGDESAGGFEDIWRGVARGIAVGVTGREDYSTTLMTYHPIGDASSAQWFHDDEWLDVNMVQGGHCLRYQVRQQLIDGAYAEQPTKPFLDSEPIYEEHPYCWKPKDGYSTAIDVRRDAYWAVFGGAFGNSYGHHSVWQFLAKGRPAALSARGDWVSALDDEAAWQMRNLAALMRSRPTWTAAPDQDLITSGVGSGPSRLQAATAADGTFVLVYSPDGAPFEVDLAALAGDRAQLWWFDPRTGEATDAGSVAAGPTELSPPSGEDWVLVADDVTAGLGAPGTSSA